MTNITVWRIADVLGVEGWKRRGTRAGEGKTRGRSGTLFSYLEQEANPQERTTIISWICICLEAFEKMFVMNPSVSGRYLFIFACVLFCVYSFTSSLEKNILQLSICWHGRSRTPQAIGLGSARAINVVPEWFLFPHGVLVYTTLSCCVKEEEEGGG